MVVYFFIHYRYLPKYMLKEKLKWELFQFAHKKILPALFYLRVNKCLNSANIKQCFEFILFSPLKLSYKVI